jgi:excisionase family DNA binding protein
VETVMTEQIGAKMSKQEEQNERLAWPVEAASRRISVSEFTVRRLIKSGHLRAVRVGKRVLIPEAEIQRVTREGCGKYLAS